MPNHSNVLVPTMNIHNVITDWGHILVDLISFLAGAVLIGLVAAIFLLGVFKVYDLIAAIEHKGQRYSIAFAAIVGGLLLVTLPLAILNNLVVRH